MKNLFPKKQHTPGPIAFFYKVDFLDMEPVRVRIPKTIPKLLEMARDLLDLPRPAKQVLNENGEPYTDIESIPPKAKLYISCTEPTKNEEEEPLYKSRLPRKCVAQPELNLPPVKQPKPKKRRDDAALQQCIAMNHQTVRENLTEAILAMYNALTPDQKKELDCDADIKKLLNDAQQFYLIHSMFSQFIGPSTQVITTDIGKQTNTWCIDNLKGIKVNDCRFVITGTNQSGKSTILMMLTNLFYQKLQLAGEAKNYLLIPINWAVQYQMLDDFSGIFNLYIDLSLSSLKYARMDLAPIIPAFRNWLRSLIVVPALPPLPPQILHLKGFPTDLIVRIGDRIHRCWFKGNDMNEFYRLVTQFPTNLAHSFCMKNAVYIYDHFDLCEVEIPPIGQLNKSENSVVLSDILIESLNNVPFFLAPQDDAQFFNFFDVPNYRQLSTERVVKFEADKELIISDPAMTIKLSECQGCPAYCAKFLLICEMVEKFNQKVAIKSSYSRIKANVDINRKWTIKQEIFKLILQLSTIDNEVYCDSLLDKVLSHSGLDVQLR